MTIIRFIYCGYSKLRKLARIQVVVVVTTAKELSSGQESKVNAALNKFMKEGQSLPFFVLINHGNCS